MLAWTQNWLDTPEKASLRIIRLLGTAGLPYVRDVVIPDEVGGYTQIDHLLLTAQGLVLLEWQYLRGVLHGSDYSQQWTRFEGKARHDFDNPLKRMQRLAQTLDQLLPGAPSSIPLHGFLLMSGTARFAKGWPQGVLDEARLRAWLDAQQGQALSPHDRMVWNMLLARVACEPVVGLV